MKSIRYDKIPVKINGDSILASNFSLSQSASVEPIYTLGRSGVHSVSPTGARSYSLSFNYIPVFTLEEPNKGLGDMITLFINNIKNNKNSSFSPFSVDVAGLTSDYAVLNSLNFSVAPYSLIQFSVSFSVLGEFTGELSPVNVDDSSEYLLNKSPNSIRKQNDSNYTKFTASPELEDSVMRSLSYSFNLNYEPVFKIGQEFPFQIMYQSAVEEASVEETKKASLIDFRGDSSQFDLTLHTLDPDYFLNIKMINPILVSESTAASSNDILSSSKILRSFY